MHPSCRELVQQLLKTTVNVSFNRITVDGDTSTNDSCIFVATGQAGTEIASTDDARYVPDVLTRVMKRLAQLIVREELADVLL